MTRNRTKTATRSKLALTLRDLVRETNRGMKERSKRCRPHFRGLDKKTMTWTYHTACTDGNPVGYDAKIRIVTEPWAGKKVKPEKFDQIDVQVSCTCPAFAYWGPERNSIVQKYNLPPLQGTGAPPKRNLYFADGSPYTSALLCKHLVAASEHLVRQPIPWPSGFFTRLKERVKKLWPFGRKKGGSKVSARSVVQQFAKCSSKEDPSMLEMYYAQLLEEQPKK